MSVNQAMAWSAMGEKSLAAAKMLRDSNCERSCISRAYYAAYAAATARLIRVGATVSSQERANPHHAQVPRLLLNNLHGKKYPNELRKHLSRRMRHLRRMREIADYLPGAHVDKRMAIDCLRDASQLLEAMEK